MRIQSMRALRDSARGVDVLHAEAALEGGLYVQAHDNGAGRYYALTRQSWFLLRETGEEEEDPIEEYAPSGEREAQEPDFTALLAGRERREDPFEDSAYAELFCKADRLLDDLLEEIELA